MLAVFIIVLIVIGLYVSSYVINKKVERPDVGLDFSGCSNCGNKACTYNENPTVPETKGE